MTKITLFFWLLSMTALWSPNAMAAGRVPRLQVKLQRHMLYSASVSPGVELDPKPPMERIVSLLKLKIGHHMGGIAGSQDEIVSRGRGRKPTKAHVTVKLKTGNRNSEGARVNEQTFIVRDHIALPKRHDRTPSIYRGANGTVLFAEPIFQFIVSPIGIPREQIAKVIYVFPARHMPHGSMDRNERTSESMSGPGTFDPFALVGQRRRESFPVAATVHLKDGRKIDLQAVVGER